MLTTASRKASVVKNKLCSGAVFFQFKADDGINSRVPTDLTPCLDNSLPRDKLKLSANDVVAKDAEWTASFPADLRRLGLEVDARGRPAQQLDLLKLLCVDEGIVDTLSTHLEKGLLMDGLRRMR